MIARNSERRWEAPRLLPLGVVMVTLLTLSCGGGGGGSGVHPAEISCSSGSTVAASAVGMTCGGAASSDTEKVNVVFGGPSTGSITLRGFNFDVTYAASKVEFVPAASYSSPSLPDALVAVTLYNGQQGRVVVSIQQPGSLAAVSVAAGQHTIVGLSFRRVAGATVDSTPLAFENAEATGASVVVDFTSDLSLSYP